MSVTSLKSRKQLMKHFKVKYQIFFTPPLQVHYPGERRNESHISRQSSLNCGHVITTLLWVVAKELMPCFRFREGFVLCMRSKQEQKVKGFSRERTDLVGVWVKRKHLSPQPNSSVKYLCYFTVTLINKVLCLSMEAPTWKRKRKPGEVV